MQLVLNPRVALGGKKDPPSKFMNHKKFTEPQQGVKQISRYDFQEIFCPKLSTLCIFFEAVSKFNEEACGDRPHLTPITRSIGESADTY